MLRTRESCREVKMVARKRPWFVMVLHSHLPWVMGYGRWPFGEEWIYEIAWDCYIPLIRAFRNLERDGILGGVHNHENRIVSRDGTEGMRKTRIIHGSRHARCSARLALDNHEVLGTHGGNHELGEHALEMQILGKDVYPLGKLA